MCVLAFFFFDKIACGPDWLQTHSVAKDDLELLILLYSPGSTGMSTTPRSLLSYSLIYWHLIPEPRPYTAGVHHGATLLTRPMHVSISSAR